MTDLLTAYKNNTYREFVPKFVNNEVLVIKVYDGDTVTVIGKLESDQNIYKYSVRLAGIDTPEIKSKCPNESACARFARDCLSECILYKIVQVNFICYDKYGRLLCEIFKDSVNITDFMLEKKLGVRYDGNKKQQFIFNEEWRSKLLNN